MIILKYIITFILGIVSSSFITIILITLNCGIPVCRNVINFDESSIEKQAAEKVIKKYCLSLFIDTLIVIVFSLIVFNLLHETFIFYIILVIVYTSYVILSGGIRKNENNVSEVYSMIDRNKENINN